MNDDLNCNCHTSNDLGVAVCYYIIIIILGVLWTLKILTPCDLQLAARYFMRRPTRATIVTFVVSANSAGHIYDQAL